MRVLQQFTDAPDCVAVVTVEVDALPAGLVAAALSAEHGIGVRDGRFCAHPLLARLTGGRDAVRASLGLATTTDDVDRFVAALATLLRHGPSWTYALRDGRWVPTPTRATSTPCGSGSAPRRPAARAEVAVAQDAQR